VQQRIVFESVLHQRELLFQRIEQSLQLVPTMHGKLEPNRMDVKIERDIVFGRCVQQRIVFESVLHQRELLFQRIKQSVQLVPTMHFILEPHWMDVKIKRDIVFGRRVQQRLVFESVLHQRELLFQRIKQSVQLVPTMHGKLEPHWVDVKIERNNLFERRVQRRIVCEPVLHRGELLLEWQLQHVQRMSVLPAGVQLYGMDNRKQRVRLQGWQRLLS